MTGAGGFGVDSEELRSYAKGLADRGGQVDGAARTASGVNLGMETFGILLGWFPSGLNSSADEMVNGINELSAAIDRAVQDVREAADNYDRVEDANRANIDSIGGVQP